MWKESYRIGVSSIDAQHYTLFLTADRLFKALRGDNQEESGAAYREIITFMKRYVVRHFSDEEAYQASIGYIGMAEHCREHRRFTNTVLEYDKWLQESDYAVEVVKQFAGTLLSWLIYHVAKEDQKYAHVGAVEKTLPPTHFLDCFAQSLGEVLGQMTGLKSREARRITHEAELPQGEISVCLDFVGDVSMTAQFFFPEPVAFRLLGSMTLHEITAMDEFVRSAMSEIVNITSGNVAVMMQALDLFCDIKPPKPARGVARTSAIQGVRVCTEAGDIGIVLYSV